MPDYRGFAGLQKMHACVGTNIWIYVLSAVLLYRYLHVPFCLSLFYYTFLISYIFGWHSRSLLILETLQDIAQICDVNYSFCSGSGFDSL